MSAAARLAACIASLIAGAWAGAEAVPSGIVASPSLAGLLADFERAYRPSDFVALPLADALAGLERAERRVGPQASLGESLAWGWSGAADLRVDAHVSLPLYSSRAPLAVALARSSLEAANVELAAERRSARAAFLGDLYAAALFGHTLTEVVSAVEGFRSAHPALADAAALTAGAAGGAGPERAAHAATRDERVAIELVAAAEDLRTYLASQLEAIGARLKSALRHAGSADLDVMSLESLLPELRSALPPLPSQAPSEAACLRAAPAAALARARYQQATAASRLEHSDDLSVQLSASASFSTASGLSGYASLSAELALPAAWPVAGSGSAAVGTDGLSQRLELRWPKVRPPPLIGREPEADLAQAVEEVLQLRRSAVAAVEQAARGQELATLRLIWFVQDALGPLPAAGAGQSAEAASVRFEDPIVELQAAELRARLAFAELSLALAHIDLAVVCGWSP